MNNYVDQSEDEARYLIFRLGSELYGTPLLGIREVVEAQETKPIPNTLNYFTGVINIRGEVVGVIDLRLRFGQSVQIDSQNAMIVFDTENGPLAALVDKVEAVSYMPGKDIEQRPNVKTSVPLDFLLGIGKLEDRLVTLIDLNRTLGADELSAMKEI